MSAETLERLLASRIIAIIRSQSGAHLVETIHALVGGGITCVEVTMNTPGALDALVQAGHESDNSHAVLGVGTVLDESMARDALDAGAQFLVTPTLNPEVIRACKAADIVVVPGAFSPTEIQQAWDLGADMVKVFPAGVAGPGYIKSLLGPLPYLRLLPTGGLTPENAADYIIAGASAVGLGGALIGGRGPFDAAAITARAHALVTSLQAIPRVEE